VSNLRPDWVHFMAWPRSGYGSEAEAEYRGAKYIADFHSISECESIEWQVRCVWESQTTEISAENNRSYVKRPAESLNN